MDKRKEAVLQLLKATGQATLADVAAHLEVSKQGTIRHLAALEGATFGGRGDRPAKGRGSLPAPPSRTRARDGPSISTA